MRDIYSHRISTTFCGIAFLVFLSAQKQREKEFHKNDQRFFSRNPTIQSSTEKKRTSLVAKQTFNSPPTPLSNHLHLPNLRRRQSNQSTNLHDFILQICKKPFLTAFPTNPTLRTQILR